MAHPIYVVDAFTDQAFAGNPAAVCLLDRPASSDWMQLVAAEMRHSETAFLLPEGDSWSLRWFTPTVEVALCGHATLASAHTLWESGRVGKDQPAVFATVHSGVLTCHRLADAISMDFPAKPMTPIEPPIGLAEALHLPIRGASANNMDILVEVDSEEALAEVEPDFARLSALPIRGVIVTSRSSRFDFVSRFFAPGAGVPEDPVTGSAHCALAPYWGNKLGKTEMIGFQASPRGGTVRVKWLSDRVQLVGQAVTILAGQLQC